MTRTTKRSKSTKQAPRRKKARRSRGDGGAQAPIPAPRLHAELLRGWTHLVVTHAPDVPWLRGLARALKRCPWRDVLDGEASYGPGNNADLHYWACSTEDGTAWLLQLEERVDDLEGFRNSDDEGFDDDDDRDPHVSVSEEVVAAVRVPPGTDESEAVRRLVRLWERRGDGRTIELVTSEGVFDLDPPKDPQRPQ